MHHHATARHRAERRSAAQADQVGSGGGRGRRHRRPAVAAGRRARADVAAEIESVIGPRATTELRRHLRKVARATGALDHLVERRHRPEASR